MGLNIESTLSLNSAQFTHGLGEAAESLKEFAISAIGIASVGEALKKTAETALEFAESTKQGSQRLNTTTEEFQRLAYAASKSNVEVGDFEGAFDRLAKSQVEAKEKSGGARDALYALGLSLQDIKDKSPGEIFDQISETISKSGTNAERTAALMQLLGRGAGSLIPMMTDLKDLKKEGGAFVVDEKDIERLDKAKGAAEGFMFAMKSAVTTIAANVIKNPIDTVAEFMSTKDSAQAASQIRNLKDKLAAQKAAAEYAANGMSDTRKDYREGEKTESQIKDHDDALAIEKKITEEKEKQRKIGMSDAQKRVELKKEIASLEYEVKQAPFEGLSEKETAEKKLKLEQARGSLKEMDSKPQKAAVRASDSLVKVGNFFGASKGVIGGSQATLAQHTAQTASNTKRTADAVDKLAKAIQEMPKTNSQKQETIWPAN